MTINVQFAGADARIEQQPIAPGTARLLAAIDDLAPELAARAAEIERLRRIPADITDRLLHMGLFRTLLPRSHGGLELSVPEVLPLVEALSAADSSVEPRGRDPHQVPCDRLASRDAVSRGGREAICPATSARHALHCGIW